MNTSHYNEHQQREQERQNAPQKCPYCDTEMNQNLRPWDKIRQHCGSDKCRKAASRANIAMRKRLERDEASLHIDTYAAKLPEIQKDALLQAKALLMQADYEQGHNIMLKVLGVIEAQKCRHDRISVLIDNANAAKRRAEEAEEHNRKLTILYQRRIDELEAELHGYQLLEGAIVSIATHQLAVQPEPKPQLEQPTHTEPEQDRAAVLATLSQAGIKPVEEALAEQEYGEDTER